MGLKFSRMFPRVFTCSHGCSHLYVIIENRTKRALPRLVDIGFIRRLTTNSRDEQTFEAQRLSEFGQI